LHACATLCMMTALSSADEAHTTAHAGQRADHPTGRLQHIEGHLLVEITTTPTIGFNVLVAVSADSSILTRLGANADAVVALPM